MYEVQARKDHGRGHEIALFFRLMKRGHRDAFWSCVFCSMVGLVGCCLFLIMCTVAIDKLSTIGNPFKVGQAPRSRAEDAARFANISRQLAERNKRMGIEDEEHEADDTDMDMANHHRDKGHWHDEKHHPVVSKKAEGKGNLRTSKEADKTRSTGSKNAAIPPTHSHSSYGTIHLEHVQQPPVKRDTR
ncbi:unnamed protein product [Vitrella brassicaformis CCMP3155]|uniref:Uncharacterized protein n=1 Tax=Vitrella brassicaformis (strain CCMP3155) TaxID=1169540 RepID=A0A0G4FC81_VITBC|nr:unnamed protein product [Vitrella brassicaformis CCMP3155]|mmetsp:Transcript_14209/g.33829  ORF Transcript_14209/g.33829 Transcript_14209/m.33829 type:complete len:188 (-) Transcript_14209:175-738(-)|eukprot:CEM10808.1 unnamed protein product [Vitrella brassicaformis CCMP3155]